MELRTNSPIPHPINLKLKHQPRTLNLHIQRKVQVVKLHALGRRQAREQTLRYGVQICSECADVDQSFYVRIWGGVRVAGYEVVFDDQGLTGPEVARVVEGYGVGF